MARPSLETVSWERMENAVENVRRRLLRVASALRNAGLDYAVVGGNAVAAWVSRVDEAAVRNTRDVDILLQRQDFDRAKEVLEQEGFVYRRLSSLGKTGTMDAFLDGPGAKVREAMRVLWAGEKVFPDSLEASPDVSQAEDAGDFRLIDLEPLVRMKLTSYRDKDRMHLRDLAGVGLIDETWSASLPKPLAERLQTILDDPDG